MREREKDCLSGDFVTIFYFFSFSSSFSIERV